MTEEEIIKAYTKDLTPMIEIASRLHVSRQSIWKLLKKHKVDTSKARRIEVKCQWCERLFMKRPSEARRHNHHYCSFNCYLSYIFDLLPDNIVHHEDKDTLNNILRNLKVFENHSEHMRYHRGGEAKPLWEGR